MRVLILGGGGTMGAFSAGALRALSHAGWHADALVGSSAGSINLLRAYARGADGAVQFWSTLDARTLLRATFGHRLLRDGLLDPEQLHARVDEGVDWHAMLADRRPIGFIVVDLGTGQVSVRGNRTESSVDALRAVAHGSFALPPLLSAVPLDGACLADGGLMRNAPLEHALTLGATEIVYLCNVQVAPRAGWHLATSMPRTLLRYANIYFRRASNVGYADAPIVESRFHGVPFLTIAPPPTLRLSSALLPTPRSMRSLVDLGETCALRAIEEARHVAPEIVPSSRA